MKFKRISAAFLVFFYLSLFVLEPSFAFSFQLPAPSHFSFPISQRSYDSVGNRLSLKKNNALFDTYTYDSANRLLTSKNKTYSYDPNGNLTQEKTISTAVTRSYAYDFENRLKQVTQGTNKAVYFYDGLGRRAGKNVNGLATRFYHDGFEVLFETNSLDTITRTYIHGSRIDEILQSGTSFYLSDGLGSTSMLTSPQGTSITNYAYDVFGVIRFKTGNFPNNYLFTGRELDNETGLYYYRNRYYNPAIGRFITKDPIGLEGGMNEYAYALNDPVNNLDPDGLLILPKGVRNTILGILVGIASTVGVVREGQVKGPQPRPKEKEVITAPLTPVKEEKKPKGKKDKGKGDKSQCDTGFILPSPPDPVAGSGILIDIVFVT